MDARTLPIWLGVMGIIITVVTMASLDVNALRAPMQFGLRASFLLISVGAIWQLQWPITTQWKWAVGAALTILIFSVAAELVDVSLLGATDSLEQRLLPLLHLRLGLPDHVLLLRDGLIAGDRFLVVQNLGLGSNGLADVFIVTNWFTELRERMDGN